MSANSGQGGSPFVSSFFRARRRRMHTLPFIQQSHWADSDDAEAVIFSDWMWDTTVVGGATGDIKAYVGGSWTAKPVKVWDGTSWVVKPLKAWNGGSWTETDY